MTRGSDAVPPGSESLCVCKDVSPPPPCLNIGAELNGNGNRPDWRLQTPLKNSLEAFMAERLVN